MTLLGLDSGPIRAGGPKGGALPHGHTVRGALVLLYPWVDLQRGRIPSGQVY